MSRELAKLGFKLQKAFAPSVHIIVPKILFTLVVKEVVKEKGDEVSACKELFRQGVWAGSLAVTNLASLASLMKFWPGKDDPHGVAGYAEMIGGAFWRLFVGHGPRVKTEVLDDKGLVWAEVTEAPGADAFYKVIAPAGVDTLFFVSGMYEGAFQTILNLVGAAGGWIAMWRPLGSRGVCGFLGKLDLPPSEAAKLIEAKCPSFFRIIDWDQSVAFTNELLGVEAKRERSSM
ncbi:MAG: hypothetical protein QXZ31_07550 [Thermofilaceae archaeon]